MRKQLAAAVAALTIATTTAVAPPAAAETVRRADPNPRCSQAAPLDVKRATFTYSDRAFRTRLKVNELSRRKTQVFSRLYVQKGDALSYGVQLISAFRKGSLRTVGYWSDYEDEDFGNRFRRGLRSSWDFADDTVTFRLTKHLRGNRVDAAAYSVRKGADHGPPCGDYIYVSSLDRG